jgi:hypothetical protein
MSPDFKTNTMDSSVEKERGSVPETPLIGAECTNVQHPCSLMVDSQESDKAEEASLRDGNNPGVQNEGDIVVAANQNAEEDEIDEKANHVHGIPMLILAFGLCIVVFLIG